MTFPPPPPRPARPGGSAPARRRSPLLLAALVVGAVLLVITLLSQFWTDLQWYRQLGYDEVFTTRLVAQAVLFLVAAALMAGGVALSLSLAYRTRPIYAPVSQEAQNLDRYRESLEPLRRVVLVVLPTLVGLFAGSSAASQWDTVLLWLNRTPFGTVDAQFGVDIGFFVFTLPLLRFALGLLTAVVVLALIGGAATHYLYGGLRLQGPGARTTKSARVHLAVLGGVLALLQAGSYFLDRYSRVIQGDGFNDIAGYTDVTTVIPARLYLAIIAVLVAVLFFSTIVTGNWRLPLGGIAVLVVVAVVIGGVVPAAVQRFQVQPSANTREAPYIEKNIDATTAAFGLSGLDTADYIPESDVAAGSLAADAATTASIRLLDPSLVSPAFGQLEQNRAYYGFPDVLDVDRYEIDGETQDTVIAVRELNQAGLPSDSWVNRHIVYTHGYGVVAAAGNQRAANGAPSFLESGIPSTGVLSDELGDFEQRIYFGESSPDFSIVGAPEGTAPQELDFPDDSAENDEARTTYTADGGPSVGSLFSKLLYAIRFQDQNILLSSAVNAESQILYDRSPRERVEKVAPYLTLDGDPYPAIVDNQVVWIVDGYTTSNAYPYSQSFQLGEVTQDSVTSTAQNSVVALQQRQVNYIRNSVKATVDAYTGEVNLYAWDEEDPVLQSWSKVFPTTIQPLSAIGGDLMSHLRYPEDLFKVQRAVLATYHVTDAASFFQGTDFWETPADPTAPTGSASVDQPPYYLTLQMPDQEAPTFSLSTSYIPATAQQGQSRNVLTGFLAVDADAGSEDGVRREGYGALRLLELPSGTQVSGPGQVQNEFNANTDVSNQLNLLRSGGASQVLNGNLLTLPVGGGLLYVQPVYVQSATGTSYPVLRKVLVSYGGRIGFADTLDQALDQVFGGDSGAAAGDEGAPTVDPGDGTVTTPTPTPSPTTSGGTEEPTTAPIAPTGDLATALTEADTALQDGQTALANGDFAAYGEAQERLAAALEQAIALQDAQDAAQG